MPSAMSLAGPSAPIAPTLDTEATKPRVTFAVDGAGGSGVVTIHDEPDDDSGAKKSRRDKGRHRSRSRSRPRSPSTYARNGRGCQQLETLPRALLVCGGGCVRAGSL